MPPGAGEETVYIVEMLDDLAGEDCVECTPEIEVLCVGEMDIEPFRLKTGDGAFIAVDPDEILHFFAEVSVHPVIEVPVVALCASDIQDRIPCDQGPHGVEPITQRASVPRIGPPIGLQEMARWAPIGWDDYPRSIAGIGTVSHVDSPPSSLRRTIDERVSMSTGA